MLLEYFDESVVKLTEDACDLEFTTPVRITDVVKVCKGTVGVLEIMLGVRLNDGYESKLIGYVVLFDLYGVQCGSGML